MLTSKHVDRLMLPHEPGQWIEVKPLSGAEIRLCQRIHLQRLFEAEADYPEKVTKLLQEGQRVRRELEAEFGPAAPTPARATAAVDEYDIPTALNIAIKGWSYSEPVTPENIAELDHVTEEFLVKHLLPQPESEEDLKNGHEPSRTPSKGTGILAMTGSMDDSAKKD